MHGMWRLKIKGPNGLDKLLSARSKVPFCQLDMINHRYQYAIDNQMDVNALEVEQFYKVD